MLTHQVYFWLKNPDNQTEADQLASGLESLLSIESIKYGHFGKAAPTPAREVVDHSFSFAYYTTFDSMEDHEAYQIHETHLKFVEECGHLWEKVQVYDYLWEA